MAYLINENCKSCGECAKECPTYCILKGKVYFIDNSMCIECGKCKAVCSANAIIHLADKSKNLDSFIK